MKILVTGFDPFGGEKINPAWEAVKALPEKVDGITIIKAMIPTVFYESAHAVEVLIEEHQPNVVINVGQAGGRFGITPERVAINIDDARIPDNKSNQPIDQLIKQDGANAYFTQLPVKAMVESIKNAGLPASLSSTAGTFVCNHIMYQVQYLIATKYPNMLGGFIHVPFIMEQVVDKPNQPAMNLSDITRGLEHALRAVVTYYGKKDISVIGGTTH